VAYISATYLASNQLAVANDRTTQLATGQRLRLLFGAAPPAEVTVTAVSYDAGSLLTTATVTPSSITTDLFRIELGTTFCNEAGSSGNVCEHPHTGHHSGSYMPASRLTDACVTNVLDIPVPAIATALFVLRTTTGGDHWELADVEGTADQVIVTPGSSVFTFSLPQNVATDSSPTFAGATLSGFDGAIVGTAGVLSSIEPSAPYQVFRRNSTDDGYEWHLHVLGDATDVATVYPDAGDTLYLDEADTWVNLAIGSDGDILHVVDGLPEWQSLDGDTVDVDFEANWSTPDDTVPEANGSAQALSARLAGVDDILGYVSEYLADVRLEYVDSNTIRVSPAVGTSGKLRVNASIVSVSQSDTIDTDSAAHFVVTGTTSVAIGDALNAYTGSDYANYGLHYVYVANSDSALNLSGYDRRGKPFVSASAPTAAGYLAASGDGVNARCVGMFALNSSRMFDSALCVASLYCDNPKSATISGTGSSWDAVTLTVQTEVPGCNAHVVIPANRSVLLTGSVTVRNEDTDVAEWQSSVRVGGSDQVVAFGRAANGSNYTSELPLSCSCVYVVTTDSVIDIDVSVTATGADSSPTVRGDRGRLSIAAM
jgi:hypothetical protein